jgi:hypothetical protein
VSTSSSRTGVYPSIHPHYIYLHVSIYLARCITHSPARSLISFFPIIIKRASKRTVAGRSESLSATPEVRRGERPVCRRAGHQLAQVSLTPCEPRTFRSHGRCCCWKFSTIASLVLAFCEPAASDSGPSLLCCGLVFSQQQHRERGDFQENILCDSRRALALAIMLPTQTRPWEMRLLWKIACQGKMGNIKLWELYDAPEFSTHKKLHVDNLSSLNFCHSTSSILATKLQILAKKICFKYYLHLKFGGFL